MWWFFCGGVWGDRGWGGELGMEPPLMRCFQRGGNVQS